MQSTPLIQGTKILLVDVQRPHVVVAGLNTGSPRVPGKTYLVVYMQQKATHEASGQPLRRVLLSWDRRKIAAGNPKAQHIDLVRASKRDEVEHYLRMISSGLVAAAREAQECMSWA